MLKENIANPLYLQLAERLREEIQQGKRKGGEKLPTEKTLSDIYKVSRITTRKALAVLSEEKIIERKQGKGTFVANHKFTRNITQNLSFSQMCENNNKKAGAKVVSCLLEPSSTLVSQMLKLPPKSNSVMLKRIRYADDVAVSVETSHFPMAMSFLVSQDLTDKSLVALLEQEGISFYESKKTIELVYTNNETSKFLQLPVGYPLISIESISYDKEGKPIHYNQQLVVADKFKFSV